MDQIINSCLTALNSIGREFCGYAAGVFVQSSVLIVLLLIIDFLLRKRVRAVFRYCVWMLVFVKLILPPTLSLPTGVGYWYGDYLSADSPLLQQVSNVVRPEHVRTPAPEDFALAAEIAKGQPSQTNPQTAAPVTSAVSGLNALTWQAVVFLLWLVGVLVISVLLIQRMLFVKGLIAQSEPAKNRLLDVLNQCRRQVGIGRNIELRLSNNVSSPAVCGLFKPVILIPAALLKKLSPDKLRAVLVHELVHIKRADIWVNLVQTVLQIIYFYNPFVWLANAVVRRVREQAVDEMVLVALGAGAKSYSNTLIDIAEMAFWKTSLSLRLIGVVESKKALQRRIKHMLNRPIPKSAKVGVLGTIVIIVIAAVLLPMAKAQKKDLDLLEVERVDERVTAVLPNGVEVELAGICEDPSERGQQWWRPNGMEMKEPKYELRGKQSYKYPAFGYLLKFSPKEDLSYRSKINFEHLFMRSGPVTGEGQALMMWGENHQLTEPLPNQADVTVDVAAGDWEVNGPGRHGVYDEFTNLPDKKVIIVSGLRPNPQKQATVKTLIEATTTSPLVDIKLECITTDGKSHKSWYEGTLAQKDQLMQHTFGFTVPVEQIEKINVKHRRFYRVEFKNVSIKPGVKTDVDVEVKIESVDNKVPAAMVGTWFFDNPHGDEEQMAVFPDGRVVVLYSNGHKDQTNYVNGFIELAEYGNAKCRMAVREDGTLVQYFDLGGSESIGKRWRRIDPRPHTNLLRSLTGTSEYRAKFATTLPNGVTVELVGICEHPSRGKQWWRPDGQIIKNDLRPYASKELRSLRLPSNQQKNKILELAVKITDSSNKNVGMICSGANRTFVNCRNNVWGGTVEIDKELEVKDFKIGVAVGAWETLTSSESKFGRRRRKTPDIVFTEAYNTQKGYAVVIVTHKKDIQKENWRVVAIDKEGKPHKADLYQTQGIGEFEQNMFHFKALRSDQIKRFEFQTRPYQWIIFKNVSLKPGIKTDVQVEVEKH